MASNDYEFVTEWRIEAPRELIYDILANGEDLPRWWPDVYLSAREERPPDGGDVGTRVALHTRGWLPYTLRWTAETVRVDRPSGFEIRATGDFDGSGVWTFVQEGVVTYIRFDWRLKANKPILATLSERPRGLVLVTGPTGSGKSTTLASLIDEINRTRTDHIITIEDPIEFLHSHRRCIVNQREIGSDATGFADALRGALRQDPDVILLGEMRDLETISTALTAAETGHLVFATLHTQSAPSTIDRVIDVFPAAQQDQVRMQLANSLQGIVTQTLLPRSDGGGRVCALEILFLDDAIRNLIRQGKVEQVYSYMQTGTRRGMQTMEQSLASLVERRLVHPLEAISRSSRPDALVTALERAGIAVPVTPTDGGSPALLGSGLRVAGSQP